MCVLKLKRHILFTSSETQRTHQFPKMISIFPQLMTFTTDEINPENTDFLIFDFFYSVIKKQRRGVLH